MNSKYRQSLPGSELDYFDTRAAVDDIQPGAYDQLPYTSRVLAEQLVRRCEPDALTDSLKQIIEPSGNRTLIFPGTRLVSFVMIFSARPRWLIWLAYVMPSPIKVATRLKLTRLSLPS